jgi:hypothetical protein
MHVKPVDGVSISQITSSDVQPPTQQIGDSLLHGMHRA